MRGAIAEAGTTGDQGQGTGYGGELLKRDPYESKTDPDARMYRKGLKTGWKLRHMAHAVSENEHGLVVATSVSTRSPRAERQAAIAMMRRLRGVASASVWAWVAHKGYHEQEFVEADAADGNPGTGGTVMPPAPSAAAGSIRNSIGSRSIWPPKGSVSGSNASSPG